MQRKKKGKKERKKIMPTKKAAPKKKPEVAPAPTAPAKKKVERPEAWNTSMTGQDQLNFLADHFPEVKEFLQS